MKLLHIKNTTTKQYLNLIPIKTECVRSEFVNKSELFPPQLLRGHLFNHGNFKNVQRKCCLLYLSRMYRKSRFVPLIFTKATPMAVGPIVAFLCGSAKINLFFDTQFADPHVNNIFGLTIEVTWNTDNIIIHHQFFFSLFIKGHCIQPLPPHRCESADALGMLSCLFLTTLFPIELPFFMATTTRVSPINCLISLSRLCNRVFSSAIPEK